MTLEQPNLEVTPKVVHVLGNSQEARYTQNAKFVHFAFQGHASKSQSNCTSDSDAVLNFWFITPSFFYNQETSELRARRP